ncbi:PAS domain-containing protein, partial [bacterium]|nr:PAS domain-containing protein [bacterium]
MPPSLTGKKNRTGNVLPKGFEKAENWVLACDSMENAALILNADGIIQYANPAAIRNMGADAPGKKWALVIKDSVQIHVDEHSRSLIDLPVQRAMAGDRFDPEFWRVSFSEKDPADLLISAAPLMSGSRQTGTLVTWFDITLLNQDWEIKQAGEQKVRQLIDAVPDAMYLVDEQGILLISNQAGTAALGKSLADSIGKCLFDLIPAEVAADQKRKMQVVFRSGRAARFEVQAGGQFYDQCMYPIFDQKKQVKQVALFLLNMTPYRKIELELRKSEERYRNLVESTSDIVFQLDANYRFMYVSPVIEQTLHYQPEELIGKEFNQYIHPE